MATRTAGRAASKVCAVGRRKDTVVSVACSLTFRKNHASRGSMCL